jgi:hypothetical protein
MALACLHAYVPQVTSDSMLRTIRTHPTQLTLTKMDKDSDEEYDDMKATERALSLVLDRIGVES